MLHIIFITSNIGIFFLKLNNCFDRFFFFCKLHFCAMPCVLPVQQRTDDDEETGILMYIYMEERPKRECIELMFMFMSKKEMKLN